MKLTFLGGARTVTGSCFLIECDGLNILVESGLYQGEDSDEINRADFSFNPREIDYIIITHAHLDHSGMLPRIVKEGFRGKVIMTPATRDLLDPMLYDSAHIHESDAEWVSRKRERVGLRSVQPLYTTEDVRNTFSFFDVKPYDMVFSLGRELEGRFLDAGHILGSGMLELHYHGGEKAKKIVFSGDIGKKGNPIIRDPFNPVQSNYIIMESTYGNRLGKPLKESIEELASAIKATFKRGGNVYIPAFAVGRTQDILYILNGLVREQKLSNLNVYLDSPLAEEATRIYLSHPECYDDEAMKIFSDPDAQDTVKLHFVRSVEESRALNRVRSGIIVIAGSGMCEGGRIRHHFKHNLWRRECSIIFVGFQGKGTLGRKIVDGARIVSVLGEDVAVKAGIYTINGLSAHADQAGLLDWLSNFQDSPEVFLVHGEEEVQISFGKMIGEKFGFQVNIPVKGESYEL